MTIINLRVAVAIRTEDPEHRFFRSRTLRTIRLQGQIFDVHAGQLEGTNAWISLDPPVRLRLLGSNIISLQEEEPQP